MRSWPSPFIPDVPGRGPAVRVHDTGRGEVVTLNPGPVAGLYVCGITPYDATHLGHAATYVTFDVLGRALRDAGVRNLAQLIPFLAARPDQPILAALLAA